MTIKQLSVIVKIADSKIYSSGYTNTADKHIAKPFMQQPAFVSPF